MSSQHFECIEHTAPGQHIRQYARATSTSQEQVLQLSVKQYTPRKAPNQAGGVTILAAPALGCARELYEPMWDALYEHSRRDGSDFSIGSIWSFDLANQGASGVLNEHVLGDEPSMFDGARDLLLAVNHFRDAMPRPIVGFGHSLGANVLLNLSLLHPRLLTSLVLVEPALLHLVKDVPFITVYPLTMRKDTFPSREDAVQAHLKSPLYAKWHPKVLERFRDHAFRDLPTALYPHPPDGDRVTLKTTKHQDAFNLARASYPARRDERPEAFDPPQVQDPEIRWTRDPASPFFRPENPITFDRLPFIRPSCFYVYGSATHYPLQNGPEGRRLKMEKTGTGIGGSGGAADGQVSELVVPGGGHYVPMEQPDVVGQEVGAWLSAHLRQWREMEAETAAAQAEIPQHMRGRMSEDWVYWAKKVHASSKKWRQEHAAKSKL